MTIPLEVEFLVMSSALERSREYAARCRRRTIAAQDEQRIAEEDVIRKFNELEALRLQLSKVRQ